MHSVVQKVLHVNVSGSLITSLGEYSWKEIETAVVFFFSFFFSFQERAVEVRFVYCGYSIWI